MTPGDIASDGISSGDIASDDISSDGIASDDISSDGMIGRNKLRPYISMPHIAAKIEALRNSIEIRLLLALRTRNIGRIAMDRLQAMGVSGPVLEASQHRYGDVQERLLTRLQNAATDIREAVKILSSLEHDDGETIIYPEQWNVTAGEARSVVRGPRGNIELYLRSDGSEKPVHVEWQGPSAALLTLLPEMLAGQKLADAEMIIASLDLSMAEADEVNGGQEKVLCPLRGSQ
jgi:NADH:ubiquinone oxidoreductase subunit D